MEGGLPDGLFSNQKSQFGKIFIYFMAIWNILWRLGIFYDHLVHFVFIWYIFPVLVSCAKKHLATLNGRRNLAVQRRTEIVKKINFGRNL
jgi:hypothetical protein